jgi:pimeloyl-ACP methyl ester carboxylesterase
MSRPLVCALVAAAALVVAAPAPAIALKTRPCPGSTAFRCATVVVPLDRSGAVPGSVKLAVAVEAPRPGANGFLLALSGGPGQPSVAFADSFRASLAPALAHRRLVVLDQRGTGRSGALLCRPLQALGTLDVVNTQIVAGCAQQLGPARQFYSTTDSVQDIEAVRQAIGATKLELMGVSYGTYVAVQYARRFPAGTDGLILDSVVGPDGIDPYFLDTFERLPRVLREQCAGDRCAGATKDPVADLGQLTARLQRGPLRGTVSDLRGAKVQTSVHDESELLLMIMSGDLNPFLQAAFPGAINAAVHGDPTPLLRLRRLAQGPATPVKRFSSTLNVATTCADVRLPYSLSAPLADRWDMWRHGVDRMADTAFAPFSRESVIDTSVAHDCLRWPVGDQLAAPSADPLPDVPALLLSGRLDTRTPVENSRKLLPSLPHGQLLTVAGTGHDVLDSDITGCAARALRRFAAGLKIGTPCQGRSNAVTVLARPPRSVSDYRSAPGVGGARGRVLSAALDTLVDAQITALQTLYAGFSRVQGGGLRRGTFSASRAVDRLRLHGYSYVPGVAVTGVVRATDAGGRGTLTVNGPGGIDGHLALQAHGVVTGLLGGRRVRYRARRGAAAMAAWAGTGRVPAELLARRTRPPLPPRGMAAPVALGG